MSIKLEPQRKTPLQQALSDVIVWMESTLELNEDVPRCPNCSETENLKGGWAGGNYVYLCPDAAWEQENER